MLAKKKSANTTQSLEKKKMVFIDLAELSHSADGMVIWNTRKQSRVYAVKITKRLTDWLCVCSARCERIRCYETRAKEKRLE